MFAGHSAVGWAYNWESDNKGLPSDIPYIPTLWGSDSMWTSIWDTNAKSAINNGAKWFFGPNEPDYSEQANLSPDAAADLWRQYMEPYAGQVGLVAPAVTSTVAPMMGSAWLEAFLKSCSDCTIDAVGQHWYGSASDVQSFKDTVNKAIEVSGKGVWVNEIGADGTDDEKAAFLEEIMPWLDGNDQVL
jgi:O-glycosyl hydrolase